MIQFGCFYILGLFLLNANVVICRYYTDPSGTFWQCNAKAIGSGSEGADSSLQEQYNKVIVVLDVGCFLIFQSALSIKIVSWD